MRSPFVLPHRSLPCAQRELLEANAQIEALAESASEAARDADDSELRRRLIQYEEYVQELLSSAGAGMAALPPGDACARESGAATADRTAALERKEAVSMERREAEERAGGVQSESIELEAPTLD